MKLFEAGAAAGPSAAASEGDYALRGEGGQRAPHFRAELPRGVRRRFEKRSAVVREANRTVRAPNTLYGSAAAVLDVHWSHDRPDGSPGLEEAARALLGQTCLTTASLQQCEATTGAECRSRSCGQTW